MVRVVRVCIGYRIRHPLLAVMTLAQPESIVIARAQALLLEDHTAEACRTLLHDVMALAGVEVDFVTYAEDARVLAVRLMQNTWDSVRDDVHGSITGERY